MKCDATDRIAGEAGGSFCFRRRGSPFTQNSDCQQTFVDDEVPICYLERHPGNFSEAGVDGFQSAFGRPFRTDSLDGSNFWHSVNFSTAGFGKIPPGRLFPNGEYGIMASGQRLSEGRVGTRLRSVNFWRRGFGVWCSASLAIGVMAFGHLSKGDHRHRGHFLFFVFHNTQEKHLRCG